MNTLDESKAMLIVDCLQYCNWSEQIFQDISEAGVSAIHATVSYHGNFQSMVRDIVGWNKRFEAFPQYVFAGRTASDILKAQREGRTAIFFGLQNPSPIEDDIGLIEVAYDLGIRFMQLTYNVQSLLASGCYEATDSGVTAMGREAIREMNRLGMVIDMSHSGTKSTLETIDISSRPIAITHANPSSWHDVPRGKPDDVIRELAQSGGMLGFSLYTHHLRNGVDTTIEEFCEMVARTADMIGAESIGIGSDLCQNQPDSVVTWMRNGNWMKYGQPATFPPQPAWFRSNRDLPALASALGKAGFNRVDIKNIMGRNWLNFYERSFGRAHEPRSIEMAETVGIR